MFSSNIQRNHSSKLLIKIQLYRKCSFNLISELNCMSIWYEWNWHAGLLSYIELKTKQLWWQKHSLGSHSHRKCFHWKMWDARNMEWKKGIWIRRCFLKMQCLYVFTAKESVVNNVHLVHVYTEKLLSRMQKHVLCEWPVNSEDNKTNSGGLWKTITIMSIIII